MFGYKWVKKEYLEKLENDLIKLNNKLSELKYENHLQLAAISTASLYNTKESIESLDGVNNEFLTPAFWDVVSAVKREIELREKVAELEEVLGTVNAKLDKKKTKKKVTKKKVKRG